MGSKTTARNHRPDRRRRLLGREHTIRSTLTMIMVIVFFRGFPMLCQSVQAAPGTDQLVVFQQGGILPVDKAFQEHRLSEIRNLAEGMGISVHLVDVKGVSERNCRHPIDRIPEPPGTLHLPGAHHNARSNPKLHPHVTIYPPGPNPQSKGAYTGLEN